MFLHGNITVPSCAFPGFEKISEGLPCLSAGFLSLPCHCWLGAPSFLSELGFLFCKMVVT